MPEGKGVGNVFQVILNLNYRAELFVQFKSNVNENPGLGTDVLCLEVKKPGKSFDHARTTIKS